MAYKKFYQYEIPNNTISHFQSDFPRKRVKKFLRRTVRGDTNYSLPSYFERYASINIETLWRRREISSNVMLIPQPLKAKSP